MRPKVHGSWNLHNLLPQDLDFFLLLSSVSGITGSRGQTNYAAGNTFLDALAKYRVAQGQRCISLDLGSILDIGIAAEHDLTESLEKDGFRGIKETELLALLDHCCDPSLPLPSKPEQSQIVTGLSGINGLDAHRLSQVYWAGKPLFSTIRAASTTSTTSYNDSKISNANKNLQGPNFAELLKTAHSLVAAQAILIEALQQKLAGSLNIPLDDIDPERAIPTFGIDSLVALEIRYWFTKEVGVQVGVIDIMQSPSVRTLARKAVERSEAVVPVIGQGGGG